MEEVEEGLDDNMVLVLTGDNMELLDDDMELVNDMTSDMEMLMVMNDNKEQE